MIFSESEEVKINCTPNQPIPGAWSQDGQVTREQPIRDSQERRKGVANTVLKNQSSVSKDTHISESEKENSVSSGRSLSQCKKSPEKKVYKRAVGKDNKTTNVTLYENSGLNKSTGAKSNVPVTVKNSDENEKKPVTRRDSSGKRKQTGSTDTCTNRSSKRRKSLPANLSNVHADRVEGDMVRQDDKTTSDRVKQGMVRQDDKTTSDRVKQGTVREDDKTTSDRVKQGTVREDDKTTSDKVKQEKNVKPKGVKTRLRRSTDGNMVKADINERAKSINEAGIVEDVVNKTLGVKVAKKIGDEKKGSQCRKTPVSKTLKQNWEAPKASGRRNSIGQLEKKGNVVVILKLMFSSL